MMELGPLIKWERVEPDGTVLVFNDQTVIVDGRMLHQAKPSIAVRVPLYDPPFNEDK